VSYITRGGVAKFGQWFSNVTYTTFLDVNGKECTLKMTSENIPTIDTLKNLGGGSIARTSFSFNETYSQDVQDQREVTHFNVGGECDLQVYLKAILTATPPASQVMDDMQVETGYVGDVLAEMTVELLDPNNTTIASRTVHVDAFSRTEGDQITLNFQSHVTKTGTYTVIAYIYASIAYNDSDDIGNCVLPEIIFKVNNAYYEGIANVIGNSTIFGLDGFYNRYSKDAYLHIKHGILTLPPASFHCGSNLVGTGLLASGSVTANGAVTAIGPCASVGYNACMNDNLNTFKIKLSGLTHTNYAVQITPRYDDSNGNGYLMPSVEQKATDYFTVHLRSTNGVFYYCGFDFVVYGSL
jgi:hypothetical protein